MDRPLKEEFLAQARIIVEEYLSDTSFSPQILAQKLGISYSVLHRRLTVYEELSPSLFIRAIRLQYAEDMLLSTDNTIAEIAYEVGFNDPKYFSRVFGEAYGMSPSKFRRIK